MEQKTSKKRYYIVGIVVLALLIVGILFFNFKQGANTSTLYQLPNQSHTQTMSYLIEMKEGLVIIDGGVAEDADYLSQKISEFNKPVLAWFLTHPHPDHVDALGKILTDPACSIQIQQIISNFPPREFIEQYELEYLVCYDDITTAMYNSGVPCLSINEGDSYNFGSVTFECLSTPNIEITTNAINNSSIVLKMTGSQKSVLFLADLGVEGGKDLLQSLPPERLKADIVQMAHHGQAGVEFEVYKAISPQICLWPTPDWLWDNDAGEGPGSGPWVTETVRDWMSQLDVETNYVAKDGLLQLTV